MSNPSQRVPWAKKPSELHCYIKLPCASLHTSETRHSGHLYGSTSQEHGHSKGPTQLNWNIKTQTLALFTLMRFQTMRFRCHRKKSIDSRPHYRLDAFWTVHSKMFENDRTARCDVSWTLRTCYKHTRLWYFRHRFHFDAFSIVFSRLHWYDMRAFSFWSPFESLFKSMSMRFRCKRSAY